MQSNHPIRTVKNGGRTMAIRSAAIVCLILATHALVLASNHYTEKQLDALATRVGKIYWINGNSPNAKAPTFLSAPTAKAPTISAGGDDSFEITDLAGRANKDPYYKVKFASGKVGYIRPEAFLEEFNVTILSMDPRANEKKHLEEQASEEKKRIEWIKSQPWSPAVKEAAIKKQPIPGLNTAEVKHVLGEPRRVTNLRGLAKVSEEHWFYPDGSVLIFNNGLLSRIEKAKNN